MGFGARDFVPRANAAKPKKLRSPSGTRSENPFFERNIKCSKNLGKWILENPPGPRLTDALRLSGSEPNRAQEEHAKNAKTGSRKCSSPGRGHLAVVFFFSLKNFQKKRKNKYKNLLKNVTGRRRKREEEEQEHQKTNGKKRSKASTLYILTPDRPPQRPHIYIKNDCMMLF